MVDRESGRVVRMCITRTLGVVLIRRPTSAARSRETTKETPRSHFRDRGVQLPRAGSRYFRVATSSFTAFTDLSIITCSSASSLNSMIFSAPPAPMTTGTPT
jgi:hypothetical protein